MRSKVPRAAGEDVQTRFGVTAPPFSSTHESAWIWILLGKGSCTGRFSCKNQGEYYNYNAANFGVII